VDHSYESTIDAATSETKDVDDTQMTNEVNSDSSLGEFAESRVFSSSTCGKDGDLISFDENGTSDESNQEDESSSSLLDTREALQCDANLNDGNVETIDETDESHLTKENTVEAETPFMPGMNILVCQPNGTIIIPTLKMV